MTEALSDARSSRAPIQRDRHFVTVGAEWYSPDKMDADRIDLFVSLDVDFGFGSVF